MLPIRLAPRPFGLLGSLPALWGRPGSFLPSAPHRGPRRRRGDVRGGPAVLGVAPLLPRCFSPGRLCGRPPRVSRWAGGGAAGEAPPPPRRNPGCPANFVPGDGLRGPPVLWTRFFNGGGRGGGFGRLPSPLPPLAASLRGQSPPLPAPLCALSAAGDC